MGLDGLQDAIAARLARRGDRSELGEGRMGSRGRCIRVLIADDHLVVRSGLETFLMVTEDLQLVGEASNGAEAVRLCGERRPDVVLMDLKLPGVDGVTATREIGSLYPGVRVLALTSYDEPGLVQAALDAGAIGYLLKTVSTEDLAAAIRAAFSGQPTLSPEVAQLVGKHPGQPLGFDLTGREREVLTLMAEGLNNREIANRLAISRSTAKNHVSSILRKFGASTRVEAVKLAIKHRLLG